MNKKFSPIYLAKRVHKKIKDRPRPLPVDWFYLVWDEHPIVMNTRPLWGYRPAHAVELRMHALMEMFMIRERRLPTPNEIIEMLRSDKSLRKVVAEMFKNKCFVEMTEVDYEIGIRHATSSLREPRTLETSQMIDMVESGVASTGQVIEAFYRGQNQYV